MKYFQFRATSLQAWYAQCSHECCKVLLAFYLLAQLGVFVYGIVVAAIRLPLVRQCKDQAPNDLYVIQLLYNSSWAHRVGIASIMRALEENGNEEARQEQTSGIIPVVVSTTAGIVIAVLFAALSAQVLPRIIKTVASLQVCAVLIAVWLLIQVPINLPTADVWEEVACSVSFIVGLLILVYLVACKDSIKKIVGIVKKAATIVLESPAFVRAQYILGAVALLPTAAILAGIWLPQPADGTYAFIPALVICQDWIRYSDMSALNHKITATIMLGCFAAITFTLLQTSYCAAVAVVISSPSTENLKDAWAQAMRNKIGILTSTTLLIVVLTSFVATAAGAFLSSREFWITDPTDPDYHRVFGELIPLFTIFLVAGLTDGPFYLILRLGVVCYVPAAEAFKRYASLKENDTATGRAISQVIKSWMNARPREYFSRILGSSFAVVLPCGLLAVLWTLAMATAAVGVLRWVVVASGLPFGALNLQLLVAMGLCTIVVYFVGLAGILATAGAMAAVVPLVFIAEQLAADEVTEGNFEGGEDAPLLQVTQASGAV